MSENQDNNLISVFSAPDEATANIVAGLLESEDIAATILTSATAWGERAAVADSIERMQTRLWGDVAVTPSDVEKSLELISAYQPKEAAEPETKPGLNWQKSYTPASLRMPCVIFAVAFAIAGYIAWIGNNIAESCITFTAGIASVLYGWAMASSTKYVPTNYRNAHNRVVKHLYMAAVFSGLMWLRSMGLFPLPKFGIVIIYALGAAFFVYSVFRILPSDWQSQQEHDHEQ